MMQRRRHRGLSMVELVLTLSLAAMILVAVLSALVGLSNSVRGNDRHLRARHAASFIMNYTLAKIRRAKMVHCEPAGADGHNYSRLEILDEGVWNPETGKYESTQYTVIELEGDKVYVGSGTSPDSLTTSSGMIPVLSNVRQLVFHSIPEDQVHTAVSVLLTVGAIDSYNKKEAAEFSLTGSAALRSILD